MNTVDTIAVEQNETDSRSSQMFLDPAEISGVLGLDSYSLLDETGTFTVVQFTFVKNGQLCHHTVPASQILGLTNQLNRVMNEMERDAVDAARSRYSRNGGSGELMGIKSRLKSAVKEAIVEFESERITANTPVTASR